MCHLLPVLTSSQPFLANQAPHRHLENLFLLCCVTVLCHWYGFADEKLRPSDPKLPNYIYCGFALISRAMR